MRTRSPRIRSNSALFLVSTLVIASCGTSSGAPATNETEEIGSTTTLVLTESMENPNSTTTQTEAPTTSTTVATTEAPTTTTTTRPETTTTTRVETFAYPSIGNVAFLDGLAIGWFSDGVWFEMPTGAQLDEGRLADPLFDAAPLRYAGAEGATVTRQGSPLTGDCTEVGNMWTVQDDPLTKRLVGTSGRWDLRPRPVDEIGVADAHRQSVIDVVRASGVANPVVKITSVHRFDAEGDGVDEVLIAAENLESGGGDFDNLLGQPEGAYSMVLLRRIGADGTVETVEVASFVVDAENANSDSFPGFINFYRLIDVVDLDGDDVFEPVIESGYYEGGSVGIYEIGDEPSNVVSAGCGV